MQRWLMAVVTLGISLAGCSGKASPAAPTASTPHLGAIAGLVVDEAIRPLDGATVRTPEGTTTVSSTQGTFHLDDLAPGAHLLAVNRSGYLPVQVLVQVEPGSIAHPRIQLATAGTQKPYHEALKFRGHVEASAGLATTVADQVAGGLATCTCSFSFTVGSQLTSILVEASWQDSVPDPAGPTKYTWQVLVDGNDAQASGQGASPIRQELQRLDFTNKSFDFSLHPAYTLHVYPDTVWPAASQDYVAFVTLWYLDRPSADFSIVQGSPA